jgi:hypothetical protein
MSYRLSKVVSCVMTQFVSYALEVFGLTQNYFTSNILNESVTNIKHSQTLTVHTSHLAMAGVCGQQ